jgi:hypothetical protein
VTLNGFSMRVAVSRGCPKGHVLLPLQWCLVDDLIARLTGDGINIQGFMDDICLLSVGKFPYTGSRLMQCTVYPVQWMRMMRVCCGMAVRMGMLGVSVRKMKTLTVKMETGALVGKGTGNLTCFVYFVYENNSKIFFLSRCFILWRGHLRLW